MLISNNIEVRPIVAGNIMKNPVIKQLNYICKYNLNQSNYIHDNGFYIGNGHIDLKNQILYFKKKCDDYFV
jgi:CDP-4-dehydro-6-deoxyglucose reductase, E1